MNLGLDNLQRIENHPDIATFLETACQKFKSKNFRAQVYAEILSHFEEHIIAQQEEGLSFEGAVTKALVDFGNPREIGKELYEANLPYYLRKRFFIPILSAIALTVVFVATVNFYSHSAKGIIKDRLVKIERSIQEFKSQDRKFRTAKLFENRKFGNDFGEFINNKIDWLPPKEKHNSASIVLSDKLKKALLEHSREWIEMRHEIDFVNIDISWMNDLGDFAYWDLYRHGPKADYQRLDMTELVDPPIPDYSSIAGFAEIALLQGIENGQLEAAIAKVDQFARLLYSNEIPISAVYAISLLGKNIVAYEFGQKTGMLRRSFKLRYQKEDLDILTKMVNTRANYFDFLNSREVLQAAFPAAKDHRYTVGYCHAIDDGLRAMAIYYQYYSGDFPYESNFSNSLSYIDRILESSKDICRNSPARYLWRHRDKMPDFSQALTTSSALTRGPVMRLAAKIPYLRQSVGAIMLTMVRSSFR